MSIFKTAFEKLKTDRDPNIQELAWREDAHRVAEALRDDLSKLNAQEITVEQEGSRVLINDGRKSLVVHAIGGAIYEMDEYEVPITGVSVRSETSVNGAAKKYKQDEMADEVIRWIGVERLEQLNSA